MQPKYSDHETLLMTDNGSLVYYMQTVDVIADIMKDLDAYDKKIRKRLARWWKNKTVA